MTGIGGQGIQLIAKLLAQAGIREGRQVMMFGIFMGMIRGGSSESTVVIADDEIVTPPIVPEVWGVLAMHPEGLPALATNDLKRLTNIAASDTHIFSPSFLVTLRFGLQRINWTVFNVASGDLPRRVKLRLHPAVASPCDAWGMDRIP